MANEVQAALNEQFMVASLLPGASQHEKEQKNRILRVLMRRLNLSKTLGENMIFMLNRASMLYFRNQMGRHNTRLFFRTYSRRSLHAAFDLEDPVHTFHDGRHVRVFLHQ